MTRELHLFVAVPVFLFVVACTPDLVVEDVPRPPLAADVIDLRTGDSLRVEVLLQQSARTVEGCVEVLDVSSGSTTTGRRCESVGRDVQRGPVSVGIDLPALPFGALVTLGVTARDFTGVDSTALIVTGVVDRDPPPLASFTVLETTSGRVALAWTLADNPYGTTTVRILKRVGAPPTSLDDASAQLVYDGGASLLTFVDETALFADTLGYAAWALDMHGAASPPLVASTAP
jgi:hypothetical protein